MEHNIFFLEEEEPFLKIDLSQFNYSTNDREKDPLQDVNEHDREMCPAPSPIAVTVNYTDDSRHPEDEIEHSCQIRLATPSTAVGTYYADGRSSEPQEMACHCHESQLVAPETAVGANYINECCIRKTSPPTADAIPCYSPVSDVCLLTDIAREEQWNLTEDIATSSGETPDLLNNLLFHLPGEMGDGSWNCPCCEERINFINSLQKTIRNIEAELDTLKNYVNQGFV